MDCFNDSNNNFSAKVSTSNGNYNESEFINNVGLGIAIFVFTLFITILIGKTLSKAVMDRRWLNRQRFRIFIWFF